MDNCVDDVEMYANMHRMRGNEYSGGGAAVREKPLGKPRCGEARRIPSMHTANRLAFFVRARYTEPVMNVRLFKNCIAILLLAALCACSAAPAPTPTPAPKTASPLPEEADAVRLPSATPAPTEAPTPVVTDTPTAAPTEAPTPTPDPHFTMVWASDTQTMIAHARMQQGFNAMIDWIVREADERNIAVFLHTGDMVDNGDKPGQWELFHDGIRKIEEKMPFFWAAGNHDEGYAGKSPWKNQPFVQALPEEQKYSGGDAAYMVLTVGDTQLLLLSISWRRESNDQTIAWLRDVCSAHASLPAVLIAHGYLSAKKERMNVAEKLEKQLVAVCPNIRLILSGHARGIAHEAFSYDDDGDGICERTVNALMYDIQTDKSRYGYVCLLCYDPVGNTLSVDSYSPLRDDFLYDDDHPDLERFILYNVF